MKIIKKSLSDQIYEILKLEIINKTIPFGTKIVNRTLQERFNVSSSPVRDAINRLYSDGLIENIDNTGALVIQFNIDFYLEVNEILLGITNTGIKLAIEKSNINEATKLLKEYVKKQKLNIGTLEYFKYDYEFHKVFIDYSKNSRLKMLYKQYNVLHEILLRSYYEKEVVDMQKDSIKIHEELIEAFFNMDFTNCIKLNEYHYKKAETLFKYMFAKGN